MRRFVAVLLALLLAAPSVFAQQQVQPNVFDTSVNKSIRQTGQPTGAANVFLQNLPAGVSFMETNAIASIRLREGIGPLASQDWACSTSVYSTNGAKRIGVFLYGVMDTNWTATADTGAVIVLAAMPKAHITQLPDSGVSAIWTPLLYKSPLPDTLGGIITDAGVWASYGASKLTTAGNFRGNDATPASLLPGEALVLYSHGGWFAQQGAGHPPWGYFEFCTPTTGCFAPTFFSLRLRQLGRVLNVANGLENGSDFVQQNQRVMKWRVVLVGYYN